MQRLAQDASQSRVKESNQIMEQHPVPQNISSYQFHLVGDMTLKQFLELAGGVLVGVLFYATGLPAIIKWPLILISAGFGAALAFVPLEERPLEQWIFAFFRSVYSPTLFHWEKHDNVKYFQDENLDASALATQTQNKTSTPNPFGNIPFLNKLENSETSYLSKLAGIFNPVSTQQQTASDTSTTLSMTQASAQTGNAANGQTPLRPMGFEGRAVEIKIPVQHIQAQQPIQPQPQVSQPQVIANNRQVMVTASMKPDSEGEVLTMHGTSAAADQPIAAVQQPREVVIPQAAAIDVDMPTRPQMKVEEIPQIKEKVDLTQTAVNPTLTGTVIKDSRGASFSDNAAPPSPPQFKNTVSGQVMDATGKIIDGAILEIKDDAGRAVRALRTNKAGHFLIVTPLADGRYHIVIEKEGYNFEPVEFEAKNDFIPPIAIHANTGTQTL